MRARACLQKERKMRKKKKLKPEDDSEEETDNEGEATGAGQGQGNSLDIKRGIMQRLEHLDSRANHRCPFTLALLFSSDPLNHGRV